MIRRWIASAVSLGFVVACAGRSSGPTEVIPQLPGASGVSAASHASPDTSVNELPEPPVVRAVNGVANVTLVASINPATGLPSFEYENVHGVAPTIEVKPGETFVINITDEMPATGGLAADVNLHFHGMGSSPHRPGDDVLTMLAKPGGSLHYVIHVPSNQEPGLYWYHAHVHGVTSYQVGEGGMSGAIVVDGIEKHIPALAKMKHRLIIIRATGVGQNAAPENDDAMAMAGSQDEMPDMTGASGVRPAYTNTAPCTHKDGLTVTLNGAYRPVITIAPGEKKFFRVVNATGHKTLRLNIEGEQVELVAIDGFALDTYPGTPASVLKSDLIIPPAARAEFVVTGPKAGRAKFRTLCYNTGPNGDADPYLYLAHLAAPKHSQGGYFSNAPLTAGEPLPRNVYTTALPPPSVKRLVVFSENAKPHFFINGKMFNMKSRPMFVVHVGTVEEWHVLNVTQEIHDFHIHQIHFVVESINGVKVVHPHWADSVVIPHRYAVGNKSVPGSLVLMMDFRDPLIKGEFLFHCHILDHEDQGMMAKIQAI